VFGVKNQSARFKHVSNETKRSSFSGPRCTISWTHDRLPDGQTDRQTDGWEAPLVAITRYNIAESRKTVKYRTNTAAVNTCRNNVIRYRRSSLSCRRQRIYTFTVKQASHWHDKVFTLWSTA